jgi:ferrous iron transport protein B
VTQGERTLNLRDQLDDVLLHPVWGYAALLLILLMFFQAVYVLGRLIEPPLLLFFGGLTQAAVAPLGLQSFPGALLNGTLQGITAGIAIVLPYLLPFLLGLGLLEDVGYLPRVAFLMDSLMHRIGLHGKAIVPFILGFGCNVPAVMSTRTLEEPRDRWMAAALSTLVPCAARLAVVFGLVAFYLGPLPALLLYVFNLFVIAVTGRILTSLLPEESPGLILEMPPYRVPTFKNVFAKAWFRVREFVVEAWPALIAGSAVLAALTYFKVAGIFNLIVRPITWTLGLPYATGLPLIFGLLRKELSLVMLGQALGTMNFGAAMTPVQLFTFTVFVVFYVPCLATLMVLRRELGTKAMLSITGITVVVALVAALTARLMAVIVF